MRPAPRTQPLRVLFVERDAGAAAPLLAHLLNEGYQLEASQHVASARELELALQTASWDVVIASAEVPEFSAYAALETVLAHGEDTPLIVVAAQADEAQACALMRAGAQDCLVRGHLERLAPVIDRERTEAQIRRAGRHALQAVRTQDERLSALARNVPGLLFQIQADVRGLRFLYVSEASQMLLGVSAETLLAHPEPLYGQILEADRAGFRQALNEAGRRMTTLNWEGRIALPDGDTKWINLRCSPRRLPDGTLLWEGVMWNITQSRRAEADLRGSRAQLAELSEHLQRVKEDERDRIARDIHDVLGGTLVGIKISAKLLADKLDADTPLRTRVREIEAMLDEAIATTSRVARELRPGILKEFGLAAAVESFAEDFTHRVGIPCTVLCADHDIEIEDDTALALFRTYQEALTNVTKHARAGHIEVRLTQEYDEIVLEVSDDGRGLQPEDLRKPRSFGLRSIRERLTALGGSMELEPRNPHGTTITMRAPAATRRSDADEGELSASPFAREA